MKNNYPFFILFTSTPNGSAGDGKFFYEMWNNALDSDDLYNEDESLVDNADSLIDSPDKNSFVKVKFHWSEDESKDEAWYTEQKRELNFDTRSINQELDLLFIGSTTCIFDDNFLSKLNPVKPYKSISLSHFSTLKLYDEINSSTYYLVGVDTAKSLFNTNGDFV